jgi:threonine synthase
MALSILPHLMTTAAKKHDIKEKVMILTATSGDTGKAAMAGFADVPGTGIIVFYPKDGKYFLSGHLAKLWD